jgi:uncharacterized protein (DUF849 family)
MSATSPAVIEVALNGGRSPREHPAVPLTPHDVFTDAARCFDAGATVAHIHARAVSGEATFDANWYAEATLGIRAAAPGMLVSITSLRPDGVDVSVMLDLLRELGDRNASPDLMSINLGHSVLWDRELHTTIHYPNNYEDVLQLLEVCVAVGVKPELGLMDLGYISNMELLHRDGQIPSDPWFLVELDSPGYGLGMQVAPATTRNYDVLSETLTELLPEARWAAHGHGPATYPILERALETGAHVRVGLEDTIVLPDGTQGSGNLDQVRWATAAAESHGRRPATAAQARAIIGLT